MRHKYDKSSKWLIEHHGDAILRLGGARDIRRWRALQAEVVQPGQLPDGLLEVYFKGRQKPDYFVIEIATYPEERAEPQALRDTLLVLLDRKILPEVLTVVLRPRGKRTVSGEVDLRSRLGWTRSLVTWRVVELWRCEADELLAANDVGLIPWLPLTQFQGPAEKMLEQCRERIEQQAEMNEKSNLLAVTQVLTQLRYNDPRLLTIVGGPKMIEDSPLIREHVAKKIHKIILSVLEARFGSAPPKLAAQLEMIVDEDKLRILNLQAALCPNLETFRAHLLA